MRFLKPLLILLLISMLMGSCAKEYRKVDGLIIDLKAVNGPKGIGFRTVYKFQYFDSNYKHMKLDIIEVMDKRVSLFPGDSIQIEMDPLDKLDHRVLKILYRAPRH